jgi:pyruvate dehydrogenase E1 component beta subunit
MRVNGNVATITYRDALNQALAEEMARDPDVFLMGEEVGMYNGAYKVSKGLLDKFGEKRVVDTPITELGFAGLGVGAAMLGLRPVIEFMTMNFSILALDQVFNSAAKVYYMTAGQYKCPIVFRGPTGAALQLSAQHSQALEATYVHFPGLKVVTPATPADAKGLLKASIRDNDPVIFMEGELLYNTKGEVPDDDDYVIPLGVADVKLEGEDVSIVTHGKMVHVALQAAKQLEKDGVRAEVLDLRTVRPLDVDAIRATVQKTNRVVYLEEGWPYAGIGAQIVDTIQEEMFDELDAPVIRVTQADVPMPYAKGLEKIAKPSAERVVAACNRVLYRQTA